MRAGRHGHAGAAILLGGWLLMHAPYTHDEDGKLVHHTDVPITGWIQVHAFDTAKECEAGRAKAVELKNVEFTRCVPAEHVYSPKEPAGK